MNFLKLTSLLLSGLFTISAHAICGTTTPSYCTDEKAIAAGEYWRSNFRGHYVTVINVMEGGKYKVEASGDKNIYEVTVKDIGKTKGCGTGIPRYCVKEKVFIVGSNWGSTSQGKEFEISGIASDNLYSITNGPEFYLVPPDSFSKPNACGKTNPSFCAGEFVKASGEFWRTEFRGTELRVKAIENSGLYVVEYSWTDGRSVHLVTPDGIAKTKDGCKNFPRGVCTGNVGSSSPVFSEAIAQNLNELAQVVPEAKAKFLIRLVERSGQLKSEQVNQMLVVLAFRFVSTSTAKILQEGFLPQYTEAFKNLPKQTQDLSGIEPSQAVLQIAIDVLRGAIEQDLNSATPSSNAKAMLAQLAGIQSETRMSQKLFKLQSFVEQYNVILLRGIEDPHSAAISAMTQTIISWLRQQ